MRERERERESREGYKLKERERKKEVQIEVQKSERERDERERERERVPVLGGFHDQYQSHHEATHTDRWQTEEDIQPLLVPPKLPQVKQNIVKLHRSPSTRSPILPKSWTDVEDHYLRPSRLHR